MLKYYFEGGGRYRKQKAEEALKHVVVKETDGVGAWRQGLWGWKAEDRHGS